MEVNFDDIKKLWDIFVTNENSYYLREDIVNFLREEQTKGTKEVVEFIKKCGNNDIFLIAKIIQEILKENTLKENYREETFWTKEFGCVKMREDIKDIYWYGGEEPGWTSEKI